MKFVTLHENFCIRKWESTFILIDSLSGDHFELDEKQTKVLLACNGTLTKRELTKRFNYPGVEEFITNLLRMKVLIETSERRQGPILRSITSKLPLTDALLEFTGVCNLECKHCYNARFNSEFWIKQELPLQEWKKLIDQMDALGIRRIQLSGGEPFTKEYWDEIVAYAKSKRIFIDAIASNGTLINDKIAQRLKELMGRYGAVYISLDGVTAEQHEQLRGPGTFARTLQSIRLLEEHEINVVINTMMIRPNKSAMIEFHEFIMNRFSNIKGWRIGCPKILGRYISSWKEFYVPFSEAVKIFVDILERYFLDNASYRLEMSDFFRTEVLEYGWEVYSLNDHPCSYAVNNCTVKPNGDIVFCSSLEGYKGAYLGNIKRKSLKKIWYSNTHMRFQALRIKDLPQCINCKFVQVCGGGCRSNAWLTYQDIYHPDPRACLSMKTINEKVVPLIPQNLQEEWKNLLLPEGKEPLWDEMGDIL